MAEKTYDFAALDGALEKVNTVKTTMGEIVSGITSTNSLDGRIIEHYEGYFSDINSVKNTTSTDENEMQAVYTWLESTIAEAKKTDADTASSSASTSDLSSSVATAAAGPAAAVSGPGSPSDTPQTDLPTSDLTGIKPLDLYTLTSKAWERFTEAEQKAMVAKLTEVGYSESEIADIKAGKLGVPSVLLQAVKSKLEQAYTAHPEIRDELVKLYGFDIFDANGKVDRDKLAMMLLIDAKNPNDKYDVVKLLREKYGIDLVDSNELSSLSKQLLTALGKNADLRKKIIDLYGFDIFNEDGTINEDMLRIAMLMDSLDANDDYNLLALITDTSTSTTTPTDQPTTDQPTTTPSDQPTTTPTSQPTTTGPSVTTVSTVTPSSSTSSSSSPDDVISEPDLTLDDYVDPSLMESPAIVEILDNNLEDTLIDGTEGVLDGIDPSDTVEDLPVPTPKTTAKKGTNYGAVLAGVGLAGVAATAGVVGIMKNKDKYDEDDYEDDYSYAYEDSSSTTENTSGFEEKYDDFETI